MDIQAYIDEQLNYEALKPIPGKELSNLMLDYSETNRTLNKEIAQYGVCIRMMALAGQRYGIGSWLMPAIESIEKAQTSLGNDVDQRTQAINAKNSGYNELDRKIKES